MLRSFEGDGALLLYPCRIFVDGNLSDHNPRAISQGDGIVMVVLYLEQMLIRLTLNFWRVIFTRDGISEVTCTILFH